MKDDAAQAGLMSIGTFSQMTRLSVKSLRFYAERDLLLPAHVDGSSGYRYYSLSQAGRAGVIRSLRALDMPIEQIKRVLDGGPDMARSELESYRTVLEQRIADTTQAADVLSQFIDGRKQLMPYDIDTKTMPAHHVASYTAEVSLKSIGPAIGEGFGAIMGEMGKAGLVPAGIPYIVYHDIIDSDTDGRVEMRVPVAAVFAGGGEVASNEIPEAQVATTVHRGPYRDIGPAYHALMQWMESNGKAPAGPPREIYLNDPTQVPESELLTEVAWPV